MTKLEADQVSLAYASDIPAIVQGLSISLEPGVFTGIVGPNGSGKSTLVRALSRVLRPISGRILLDGRDLYSAVSARASALSIATVPQATTIAFDFTVREIVEMGRAPHRDRNAAVVDDAMRQAGVDDLADSIASKLSGGQQQRVLIARALAQQPSVLLLDEPTSHLDIRHQAAVLRLVRDLAKVRGIAAMAVLHDLNLAAAYCDRLLLMARGQTIAQGRVEEVLVEANVHSAYGARVWVRSHPVTGRPYVLSLPDVPHDEAAVDIAVSAKVHVICGAGTGAGLLFRLKQLGYDVTAGALGAGDTDQEAAELLNIDYPREAPFTALSAEAAARASTLAAAADIIVITDVPFGKGNLGNLQTAVDAGKPVIALDPVQTPIDKRDFTGGEAQRLWNRLIDAGMRTAPDAEALLDLLSPPPVAAEAVEVDDRAVDLRSR